MVSSVFCIATLTLVVSALAAEKPHVLMLLADDYGWANSGWHRIENGGPTPEVKTPNMDQLVKNGIELDRAYSFKFCSPTRCALQSGRFPTHVNVLNLAMEKYNPVDPVSGFAGIPRNMTGMAEHMKAGGYATHQTGKWDAGMATPDHTPQGRGYDTSLGYFHHANDYWTEKVGQFVDLWETDIPSKLNGTKNASAGVNGTLEDYEEFKFLTFVLNTIKAHDASIPLFYNYDFHIVHEPLEVPAEIFKKFNFIQNSSCGDYQQHRQTYTAMVSYMDDAIGQIVDLLHAKDMYKDTIIFFQSDNGGPSFAGSSHTANNWPLKGSKMSNHEGGIRVNAFVSGGLIAGKYPHMVGTKLQGLVSIADYYATVASIAGVDFTDHKAEKANLPPVDGLDMMPYFTGNATNSPRTFIFNDQNVAIVADYGSNKLWKIIVGDEKSNCWMGPFYPNATNPVCEDVLECGDGGCLYELYSDPVEYHNLAGNPAFSAELKMMQETLMHLNDGFFDPDRTGGNESVPINAAKAYGGYWGPFLP